MNLTETAVPWLLGVCLVVWIFGLVRQNRLYVGYAVVLCAMVVGIVALALLGPSGGSWASRESDAKLIELVLLCILVLMIYIFSQLTMFSTRLTTLIQELAMRDADNRQADQSRTVVR